MVVNEVGLDDLLSGGRMATNLRAAVSARIARPMEDYLRSRLRELTVEHRPETGPVALWSIRLLRTAAAGADELRRRALRRLLEDLVGDLDELFAEALAGGDPFGTEGYERALDAIRAGRQDPQASSDHGHAVRARAAEVHVAVGDLHQAVAVRFLRGRRTEGARTRLGAAIDAWVSALVDARVSASVQAIESRLAEELGRRIEDRRRERASYQQSFLRPPKVTGEDVRRRETYAGRPVSEPRPGARLPLEYGEWDELARQVVGCEPAFLLADFAREAAGDPAIASTLARASAAELRRRYEQWVRARVAAGVTREGGLASALASLSEAERQQRIRSLAGRGATPLRGERDAAFEVVHIAACSAELNATLPMWDLVRGAVHVDEFVELETADRFDLVGIARGRLDVAEIMSADDARQLAGRLDDVVSELPTEQIRDLVRHHGLLDAFGS
jgi:hypothetical protein